MKTIKNVQLIFDRDHGTSNEGWCTRHDEYDTTRRYNDYLDTYIVDEYPTNKSVDDPIDGDTEAEALENARVRFPGHEISINSQRRDKAMTKHTPKPREGNQPRK